MFAKRLKELRKQKKITQTDFANYFNIATGTIGMWETGKREPDSEMLLRIADYFDCTIDYLLGNSDVTNTDDITFDDFTFAFYDETKELSEIDKENLLEMAKIFNKKRLERDAKEGN